MYRNNKKYDKSNISLKTVINNQEIVIDLDETESETENNLKPLYQQKNKIINIQREKNKFLGHKHKISLQQSTIENMMEKDVIEINKKNSKKSNDNSFINQNIIKINSFLNYSQNKVSKIDNHRNNKKKNKNLFSKQFKNEEENEDIVVFPHEFTERIIDALSCQYCGGIYIKPYVINEDKCGHIFCLGCIIKIRGDQDICACPICKTLFNQKSIKYSEITNFYIDYFFPQITYIIEDSKIRLNNFFESEARSSNIDLEESKKNILKCELKPFKENVYPQNRLPNINAKNNKFMIIIKSGNENVINIIKKEVIKKLNLSLKEKDIEIRIQGIEVSQLQTFNLLKNYLSPNLEEIFYYSKKGKK